MKILQDDLPLFPLNTVLFPQARLPLHIFEPRYREMIERCLQDDLAFGVLLIKEGVEVGGPAIPHAVGTIARIVDSARLEDGRYNIVTAGVTRFVLRESFERYAYLSGRIRLLADENVDLLRAEPAAEHAAQLFLKFVRTVQSIGETEPAPDDPSIELPKDPTMLSYVIGATLPISMRDKQGLLEAATTVARLRREATILERELELLRLVTEHNPAVRDLGSFSVN
ncbi:MAG: LON peptidase substrate-binding domain-containing protein [Chloroflexi bacterium]|nr:LON peptidase substrate-binding domain-containing protein [Chloroflexota bacterium]